MDASQMIIESVGKQLAKVHASHFKGVIITGADNKQQMKFTCKKLLPFLFFCCHTPTSNSFVICRSCNVWINSLLQLCVASVWFSALPWDCRCLPR